MIDVSTVHFEAISKKISISAKNDLDSFWTGHITMKNTKENK
jgi:hypothetical protein